MKMNSVNRGIVFTVCIAMLIFIFPLSGTLAEQNSDKARQMQVIVSGIDANSFIRGKDPNAYAPVKMMDGNEETCWQFSTKSSELKETFVYISFVEGVQVDQLWIKNGFWKNTDGKDQYTRNSRVKGMSITFRYSGSTQYKDRLNFTLNDDQQRTDWQKLNLGKHEQVTGIRLRINSIYKGTKYATDVCISELMAVASLSGGIDSSRYCALGSNTLVYEKPSTPLYALATTKLATRSGPGTEYTEKGTYNVAGQMIQILAKSYDINNVCWVQCRIPYHNRYVTAWTGWKRFDHSTLDISLVPLVSGSGNVEDEMTADNVPGNNSAEDTMTGIQDNGSNDDWMTATANPGNNAEDDMIGTDSGPDDSMFLPDNSDDMTADDGNSSLFPPGFLGSNDALEVYESRNPRGTLKILSRNEDIMEFEFSIERIAAFEDLYAVFETASRGSFVSNGDWKISGTFIMSGSLIILYLDNTPNLYLDLSAHEFIGAGTLVFQLDEQVVK